MYSILVIAKHDIIKTMSKSTLRFYQNKSTKDQNYFLYSQSKQTNNIVLARETIQDNAK